MATINESTSIIAVKTKQLVAGQTSVVYVSSTTDVGQLVTVFDIQGFLSAPQSILVSSVSGTNLGAGLSTVKIQQTFGYVTLRSQTNTSWSVVNENAFRSPASNYSVQGLQFGPNVYAQNIQIANTISTSSSITNSLRATTAAFGPLFVSTFGNPLSTFVTNTLYNSSNLVNRSSLFVALGTSVLSSATIVGPVNVQSNLNVAGTFTTASTMFLQSSLNTTQRILANSNISIGGQVFVGSNIQCFTSARTSTVTAQRALATNFNTNTILFDGAALMSVGPNNSLAISSSLIVSNTLQASTLNTQALSADSATILSTIFTPAISISSAAILNRGGSLAVSSIQATNIQYTTLLGTTIQSVAVSSSLFSTLYTDEYLYALSSIITTNGNIQYLSADNIVVNSIRSGGQNGLAINSMSISTITVSSALIATTMSSFVAPNTRIRARAVATAATTVLGPVVTSSLSGLTTIYDTGRLTLSTTALYTSSLAADYLSIAVGNTSTLTLSNAFLGPALVADPAAPYFLPSTFSGFTSNTPSEYIQGTGAPWSPFHIVASDDLDAAGYISGGTTSAYLNIKYTYATTAVSTTGKASIILKNPIRQSTLITLSSTNAPSFQTYALSNYFIDTNFISSLKTETLVGPMTYATTSAAQTLVAGGDAAGGPFNLAYSSDGGDTWATLPYVGFETATHGIAYGGSKWVAVGDGLTNTMIFSYTGTVWYNLGKPVFTRGLGVAYNGTIWVAVGEGTNTLATSTDGITWVGQGTTIFSTAAYAAIWNGSIWLALGAGTNTLATSPDGITWTGQGTSVFSVATYAAAWNGTLWIAVGAGTNTLATSTNGTTWTGLGTTVFQTSGRTIAWNGTNWVAGSDTQLYVPIAYSTDGTQWIRISCPLSSVYSVVWTGTQWLAGGTGNPAFATSPTGLTWTSTTSPTQMSTAYAIAAGTLVPDAPTKIIAVGQGVANIIISSDGLTWTTPTNPFENPVNCVAWNGSIWVIGTYGTYQLGYSTDGIAWTGVTIPFMTVVSVVDWGKGKWIAVGTGTSGYTRAESADGMTWTPYAATSGNFFSAIGSSVIWAQGIWVATGAPQGSGILFSLDGTNWIPQYTPLFSVGNTVYSNGTMFVAGGTGSPYTLAYSLEGSVWAPVTSSPMTTRVNAVSWANGVWVAVGQGTNTIAYSYNGIAWIGLGTTIFSSLGFGVMWTGALWVALGSGTNSIATSLDGITWEGQGTTYFVNGKDVACQIIQPNTTPAAKDPVGIRWITSGVVQITPTIIEKPARTNPGYDSYARSTDGYTASAFLQFRPYSLNGSVRIGLTTSTVPLSTLSYAFQLTDTGTFEIWEGGAIVLAGGAIAISDTFQITYDGINFYFQKNSVNLISFERSPGLPLFLEAQFNLGGTRLYDLEFHPLNQIAGSAGAAPNQFYTTSRPSGLLTPTLTFSRPLVETGFSPSLWQFAIPMSGTVVTPSSSVYADVYISTNFLFSTATLATALTPTVSTFNLSYVLSTPVATTPGDLLKVNLYTQHGLGTTSIYSTAMTTSVYNLDATQFVELVHNTGGKGAQTSDFSLWIQTLSTPFGKYVNSDAGLEMNRGFMRWNQRLYGTTIQNQYNDLQTRTMTYTGALYTASDSNLKHDTAYADTGALYETLKGLPLHRYRLADSYRARFGTEDGRQLGVLTTEVASRFPSMIKVVDSEFVPELQTVDRIQFRYAHLGATQHIMGRLSTLREKILGLVGRK